MYLHSLLNCSAGLPSLSVLSSIPILPEFQTAAGSQPNDFASTLNEGRFDLISLYCTSCYINFYFREEVMLLVIVVTIPLVFTMRADIGL